MTSGYHDVKMVSCFREVVPVCSWVLRSMVCLAIIYNKIIIKLLVYIFLSINVSWNVAIIICTPVHDVRRAPISWWNSSWHCKYSFYEKKKKNQANHFIVSLISISMRICKRFAIVFAVTSPTTFVPREYVHTWHWCVEGELIAGFLAYATLLRVYI